MTEISDAETLRYRAEWIAAARPIPLEVARARYDNPFPLSWEVLYTEQAFIPGRGGCSAPIAEFTEWSEAQGWADAQARLSRNPLDARVFIGPAPEPHRYPTEPEYFHPDYRWPREHMLALVRLP